MTDRFDYFVIFAEMRTGSNFLETNLNALQGVACHGEAFNPHFIGYPKQERLLGMTQAERDAAPLDLLARVKAQPDMLAGFRFFNDHDPRVLEAILSDPRCAKIVLTRNPAESYVSWKIAQATGQWKLTDVKRRKDGLAMFDAEEFDRHVAALQAFQIRILRHLQTTGQTAFYIAYEDLQDVDVINGIAAFLGLPARLDALDTTLKVQNPGALSDKVANFAEMEHALAGQDRFNLTRTPNFEPRRQPGVPGYVALDAPPLLFLPVKGVPADPVLTWMRELSGSTGPFHGMTQKQLRHWKRERPGHRSFTVVSHPLERAHAVFCRRILAVGPEAFGRIRQTLRQSHNLPLPRSGPDETWTADAHRLAFGGFLDFVKANLDRQTPIRIDAEWASQSHILRGFAELVFPDVILRSAELAIGLADLAARFEVAAPALPSPEPEGPFTLGDVYDSEIEALGRAAYARDYLTFGFDDWRPSPG